MPSVMPTAKTIEVFVAAYIGGRGSLWGGLFAVVPFLIATELIRSSLSNLPGLNLILYGLSLIVIMIYYPGGVAKIYQNLTSQAKRPFIRRLVSRNV